MRALKWIGIVVAAILVVAVVTLLLMGRRSSAGHIEGSIEIGRSAAELWPWMTEPDKQKQWVGWLVEIRQHSPARAMWVMEDRNNNNQRMEIEGEITESKPPYSVKLRMWAEGEFSGTAEYRLSDLGGGRTKVEQAGDYQYDHWLAKFLEPLITPQAKKKLDEDLVRLKQKVETAVAARDESHAK